MNEGRAAIRYAKATLDLAVEKKSAEAIEKDMRLIKDTLAENKDLASLLGSPIVKSGVKKNILGEIFKDCHEITKGLLGILTDNKRIDLLKEVALKYIIQYERLKGEDVAFVTTAVPIDAALKKKILGEVTKMTGKKVTIENKIDTSILGGFVLRVGDLQYDASIANKLDALKREFTDSL